MKELLEEQLKEYEAKAKAIKDESISLMKQGKPWEHIAKRGAGLKLMIDHYKSEIEKY